MKLQISCLVRPFRFALASAWWESSLLRIPRWMAFRTGASSRSWSVPACASSCRRSPVGLSAKRWNRCRKRGFAAPVPSPAVHSRTTARYPSA
jgi:hypothetical protein